MSDDEPADHIKRNRDLWDAWAPQWLERGERAWAMKEACWGVHQIPESDVGLLAGFSEGKAVSYTHLTLPTILLV